MPSAYGRFSRASEPTWFVPESGRTRTLFIDIDRRDVGTHYMDLAALIRSVPAQLTSDVEQIAVRWWDQSDEESAKSFARALQDNLQRLRWVAQARLVAFPVGLPPQERLISGDGDLSEFAEADADLLGSCRAGELGALLELNGAIWRPKAYHYRLPSGSHSDTFIRLSDAIREPHDAHAIASWLLHHVRKNCSVLVDSSSLVAIALAIEQLAVLAGTTIGRSAFLEEYPATDLDAMKAIRDVDDGQNHVMAILSVHSTGALRDRMTRALDRTAPGRWSLDVLVDKPSAAAHESFQFVSEAAGASPLSRIGTWLGLGASSEAQESECKSCQSSTTARLVHIDPRTFNGMVLPGPEKTTPSVIWASGHRRFWEIADASDAILLDAESDVNAGHPRHGLNKRMNVKIDLDRLLEGSPNLFAQACDGRLRELVDSGTLLPGYDLVLASSKDSERPDFEDFANVALASIRTGVMRILPSMSVGDWSPELIAEVCSAERILLFQLGVVSGLSLQRMLFAVQEARRQASESYALHALVTHLRTSTLREQETLANSFHSKKLCALWESHFPWQRSPLQEEMALLSAFQTSALSLEADAFLYERQLVCNNFSSTDQVLWAQSSHDDPDAGRVSPMSYFGSGLRSRAVFGAVGSAIQHARLEVRKAVGAPLWRVFEMPAIVRSYYDPIILACILRWLQPREIWWGQDDQEADATVTILIERADEGSMRVFLPELLLAAAQAKVPRRSHPILLQKSEIIAEQMSPSERAPIELGAALLRSTHS